MGDGFAADRAFVHAAVFPHGFHPARNVFRHTLVPIRAISQSASRGQAIVYRPRRRMTDFSSQRAGFRPVASSPTINGGWCAVYR